MDKRENKYHRLRRVKRMYKNRSMVFGYSILPLIPEHINQAVSIIRK